MQSFLQYRRFGRHLERQLENKGEKGIAGDSTVQPAKQALQSEGAPESKQLEKDLEAGQGPNLSPSTTGSSESIASRDEIQSLRSATTHASTGTRLGLTLTGINVRDRTTKEGGQNAGKVFVVGYEGANDNLDPHNWSFKKRVLVTALVGCVGFIVGFASAVDSVALPEASKEFGVSDVTESLATGLYLVGFGVGALFSGPLSETIGRNPVYIGTVTLYMIFIMASGLAPNIGAQLVFRFLAGFFGATPLTTAGGSLSDVWSPVERVAAFPLFAASAFGGPVMGPVIGGFIGESSLVSWRWVEWTSLIMAGLVLGLLILFAPETYGPVLLKWKAAHLRRLTGDDRYKAEIEIREETFLHQLVHALYRPFLIFVKEPIIILWSLYLTVVYIVLFTFLTGYTFIFTDVFGFSQGITGLSFMGIQIGFVIVFAFVPFVYRSAMSDLKKLQDAGGERLPPENSLRFAMMGAPWLPISLFWMAWTAYSTISPWSALVASVAFGFSVLCIFISTYQYIINSFETYAASALASITFVRYLAAGGMVEVSLPMYRKLNVHWTLTVLGCISLLLTPAPYLFYKYGPKIRSYSRLATSL